MIINITHPAILWDPSDSTFAAELSSLETTRFEITNMCRRAAPIWVENPKTCKMIKMTRSSVDTDGSGEDVYGWWYRGFNPANGKSFKFLFIND